MVLLTAMAVFLTSCAEPKAKQLKASAQLAQTANSARVKALFADPPREYSSAPLWVWNDMLTEEQIVSTMRDLADQSPPCVTWQTRK
jgi:hypothetical protein